MKIDILGSCVTRDAFALVKNDFEINSYTARSSIISLFSSPLPIYLEAIELQSNFQQRIVYADLNKTFKEYLEKEDIGMLIIDMIDERFDVLKLGTSYITSSNEYKSSNLPKIFNGRKVERNEEYWLLWEKAALEFTSILNSKTDVKVVIHKAYWKSDYYDKSGEIKDFPENQMNQIFNANLYLDRMYSFFEKHLVNPYIIEVNFETKCDENHQWGLSPYHYEVNYYKEFIQELNKISLVQI